MGDPAAATDALRGGLDGEEEREGLKCVARAILGEPASATAAEAGGCTAQFLLGAWQEIAGDPAQAKAHYHRAVATDRHDLLDFHSAKAALDRLAATK
jgi:hypothetical protein